jgi:hypothetical protein
MIELPLEKVADAVAGLRNEVWGREDLEKRALPRIRIWAPREIQLLEVPGRPAERLEVWLFDLACGGMGFLAPRALDVGREFRVTLPAMDGAPSDLVCQILHCQPAPNGAFTVGARFIREAAIVTEPEPLRQAS